MQRPSPEKLTDVHTACRWFAVCTLVLLLSADFAFIVLDILQRQDVLLNPLLDLARDQSYAEFYQYTKFWWVGTILLGWFVAQRRWWCLAWLAVFVSVLADDALALHERLGRAMLTRLDVNLDGRLLGFRADMLSELMMPVAHLALLILAWVVGSRSRDTYGRLFTRYGLLTFAIMGFCGVFVDQLHVPEIGERLGGKIHYLFVLAEDGGEHLAASLGVALAIYVAMLYFVRQRPTDSDEFLASPSGWAHALRNRLGSRDPASAAGAASRPQPAMVTVSRLPTLDDDTDEHLAAPR